MLPALPDQEEHGPEPAAGAGWRPHRRTLIVFGVLALLAIGAFAVVKRSADHQASAERARAADQAVGSIRAQLAATRADVRGVVGVFSTARTIDDFAQFAEPALANPALDAVSWAPRVTAPMRSAFESERGFTISEQAGDGVRTRRRARHLLPHHLRRPDHGERPRDRPRPGRRSRRRRRRQGGDRGRHRDVSPRRPGPAPAVPCWWSSPPSSAARP